VPGVGRAEEGADDSGVETEVIVFEVSVM
jgi:hypothetical protein